MSDPSTTLTLEAWRAAIDRLAGKINVPSTLRTEDWARVPLAIRERAFMSAGVNDARTLQILRDATAKALQGIDSGRTRKDGTPMTYSRADAIADVRAALGVEGDSGKLTDLGSYRRQQLIQDFQTEQAYEFGRHKRDLEDPSILDEYPAQEFTRVSPRLKHRTDWWDRWGVAGAAVGWKGASRVRMVALKTSPIWAKLSRFGTPFPPFDFGSGMGLRDVSKAEAEGLGLIPKDWNPRKDGRQALADFGDNVESSITGLDQDTRDWLKQYLGGSVEITADQVKLPPPPAPTPLRPVATKPAGSPISAKFDFQTGYYGLPKETKATIREANASVDQVHGDGPLPVGKIDGAMNNPRSLGQYNPRTDTIGIGEHDDPGTAAATYFHELGHRLDRKGIPDGGVDAYASHASTPRMQALMGAIRQSKTVREIPGSDYYDEDFKEYLLRPQELFARAYSQFVAHESGHAGAIEALETERRMFPLNQWDPLDFVPIREAFLQLFKDLKWME